MVVEVAIVVGFVALSLLALRAVRARVPLEQLKEQHDVAAACFAVIGGLYGIVLAFVLVSSWERFEQARSRAEAEADALSDVYRHSASLPAPTGELLRNVTLRYAQSVIDDEWSTMEDGEPSPKTVKLYGELWCTVLDTPAGDGKELVIFQNTLSKMDDFADARRDRLLYARVSLPPIVWAFLLLSGVVTIAFSYFFGLRQLASQMLMTAALAGTIAAALVLIAEMQTPFNGAVRVPPFGFLQLVEHARDDAPAAH
jgi:hypothetical protein